MNLAAKFCIEKKKSNRYSCLFGEGELDVMEPGSAFASKSMKVGKL